jgi:hypothetical protein
MASRVYPLIRQTFAASPAEPGELLFWFSARVFRSIWRISPMSGRLHRNPQSVMKGRADDPNIAPYFADIYANLQAWADGPLGPGWPIRMGR